MSFVLDSLRNSCLPFLLLPFHGILFPFEASLSLSFILLFFESAYDLLCEKWKERRSIRVAAKPLFWRGEVPNHFFEID